MGGIALEAPMYQAMLWPPALIGLAISVTATTRTTATRTAGTASNGTADTSLASNRWSVSQGIAALVALGLIVIAGHWVGSLGLHKGQLLAVVLVALAAVVALARKPKYAVHTALIAVCLLVAGGQLLQNSRGPLGLYYLSPYNWAFNNNPISEKLHTAVNTQEWLLANTKDSDTILTWVQGDWVNGDRELYVVAGMQLWGENRIGLFNELNADDLARLNSIKPNVIAMYGQSLPAINAFMAGLPRQTQPTAPNCYDFTWPTPQIPAGHACLTKLTWNN